MYFEGFKCGFLCAAVLDDENADWLSEAVTEEAPPAEAQAPAAGGAPAAAAEKPPKSALDLAREILAQYSPAEKAPKPQYKHWARPRFLQYDYLYHYMHNYYDDVIDFLDRRMRGYVVETPKPQTWAERALRTYTRNTYPHNVTYKLYETRPPKPDSALLNTPHWANTWHSSHSKDYFNRKYKAILF